MGEIVHRNRLGPIGVLIGNSREHPTGGNHTPEASVGSTRISREHPTEEGYRKRVGTREHSRKSSLERSQDRTGLLFYTGKCFLRLLLSPSGTGGMWDS